MDCKTYCQKRVKYCSCLGAGILALLTAAGIAGLCVAVYSLIQVSHLQQVQVYAYSNVKFESSPYNQVLSGSTPLVINIPNTPGDEYFSALMYNVECVTAGHTIVIQNGPNGLFWDGLSQRTATCTAGGSGFSFRFVTKTLVRVISVSGSVTFS